jgi:hypothetical protein
MSYERGPQGIQGPVGPTGAAPPVYQATYSKSVAQTLTSGATDITFDQLKQWSNVGGYITHTNGTTNFTVVQNGLYQLEFNVLVLANGATWNSLTNKNAAIDITRGIEHGVIANTALQAHAGSGVGGGVGVNYAQCVTASYYLEAGDQINLRINNTFTGGPASAQGIDGFDLNTFFSWRFIS